MKQKKKMNDEIFNLNVYNKSLFKIEVNVEGTAIFIIIGLLNQTKCIL